MLVDWPWSDYVDVKTNVLSTANSFCYCSPDVDQFKLLWSEFKIIQMWV